MYVQKNKRKLLKIDTNIKRVSKIQLHKRKSIIKLTQKMMKQRLNLRKEHSEAQKDTNITENDDDKT